MDYRDFVIKGKKAPKSPGATADRRWWLLSGTMAAQSIQSNLTALQQQQRSRIDNQIVHARLYGGPRILGAIFGGGRAGIGNMRGPFAERATFNAIRSGLDTLVARIGENKPRPYYLTDGGNYQQQRKAKKLNQWTDGVFYEEKVYDKGLNIFRDAGVWGKGMAYVYGQNGRIHIERVLTSEIYVDEIEAQYGQPRTMYRTKEVDREFLAESFPKHRDIIWKAAQSIESRQSGNQSISDMVTVCQAWHLGFQNQEGEDIPGSYSISLPSEGKMLVEPEEWPHDFFPFAGMSWCEPLAGYWPQGVCEQFKGQQIELNMELATIQRSLALSGRAMVLLPQGSQISKEHITNEIGVILTYAGGSAPQFYCPEPIHQMFFENTNRIIQQIYQGMGVSEMAAKSEKPQGLDSGRAIRAYDDIGSERFRTIARQNDNFYLDLARMCFAIGREMKSVSVRAPGKSGFEKINIKDIGSLADSEFVLQCFPVSRLPKDPSGRLQTIQEYIAADFITPRQGRRALDFPDLETIESLANAQEDLVCKILDAIVDEGEYQPPEPTDDLKLDKEMVLEFIQRGRANGLEPEKLDLLRRWNAQVDMLMERALPAAAPVSGMAPGAPAMPPQGTPPAPPPSDLMPQAA